jgi:hypothetical protein
MPIYLTLTLETHSQGYSISTHVTIKNTVDVIKIEENEKPFLRPT